MKLYLKELQDKHAPSSKLMDWLIDFRDASQHHEEDSEDAVDYQDVLNAMALNDMVEEAKWLLSNIGADPAGIVTEYQPGAKNIFLAGSLLAEEDIQISGHLLVGGSLVARTQNVTVGQDLCVLEHLFSSGSVKVGGELFVEGFIDVKIRLTANAVKSGKDVYVGTSLSVKENVDIFGNLTAGAMVFVVGNLQVAQTIKAGVDVVVSGNIACKSILANKYVEVDGDLRVTDFIKADRIFFGGELVVKNTLLLHNETKETFCDGLNELVR